MPCGVRGHSPVVLAEPDAQIVGPAYIDLVGFVDCAQHIRVAKSPPTPRLRRAAFAPPVSIFRPLHHSKAGLPAEALPLGGAISIKQALAEKCASGAGLQIALECARCFFAREASIPGQLPRTMPCGVRGHSPVVLAEPDAQIVGPAYIDLVGFVDCAQHIRVAKSPPTPRLRRAAFAPPVSIFRPLHHSKAGLPAEALPLGGAKAGEGNRTLVSSLGSWRSTIELHPHQTSPTSGLGGDYLHSCSKHRLSS